MAVSFSCQAEVFRCHDDQSLSFSDRPCDQDAKPIELAPIGRMPAQKGADLEQAHEARRERLLRQKRRRDADWLASHRRQRAWQQRVIDAQSRRQLIKGMTEQEVRRSIGRPDRVERLSAGQRWTYRESDRTQSLTFEAGKLVRFSTRSRTGRR